MKNGREVYSNGEIRYFKNGSLHNDEGPAVIRRNISGGMYEAYYRNGSLHNDEGPAVIRRNVSGGTYEAYYRNGRRYREDGPAVVSEGDYVKYYINDRGMSEQQFIEWKLSNLLK